MKIKRVAIVGGGTAGWMAANHLGVELNGDPEIEITLVESKDVPVMGVGEGTVPHIRATLQKFGISELELIASCDVTFKQGVKFANWLDAKTHGSNNFYYHPFDPPYPSGYDLTNYWLNNRGSMEFAELAESYNIAELKKSPKQKSSPPYQGVVDYAYHFNAAKFSELLAKNACDRFGVKHIFETVNRVEKNNDGSIKSLVYNSGTEQAFDFYVDCSGFASLLIDKTLKVPFVDKSAQIMTDTVLVYRQALSDNEELSPYTLSTAHQSGWVWEIPLTSRKGFGFVYSSQFMSEDKAVEKFSRYVGKNLQGEDVRKVPMKIGYRGSFWQSNCAALGLAQGFVEPLEATSILVTDFSAQLLARKFPRFTHDMERLSAHCNTLVSYTWERVIDFVQLHYFASDRRDSEFWQVNTEEAAISDVLKERLAMWRLQPPQKFDFFSRFDIFGPENYQYILYGMKYPTQANAVGASTAAQSQRLVDNVKIKSLQMCEALLSHREWLTELKKAMSKQ